MTPAVRQLVELLARAAWEELKEQTSAAPPEGGDLPASDDCD